MRQSLLQRAGDDTVGKLEKAAALRFKEANKLHHSNEPLGSLYMYGYAVEMRLKIAYYRTVGLTDGSSINPYNRHMAETRIRDLGRPGSSPHPGHDISGWARLLEITRSAVPINRPLPNDVASAMLQYADDVAYLWREYLRYRANKPYDKELEAVRIAATWFNRNRDLLWR